MVSVVLVIGSVGMSGVYVEGSVVDILVEGIIERRRWPKADRWEIIKLFFVRRLC
jgi:hypothetical protein